MDTETAAIILWQPTKTKTKREAMSVTIGSTTSTIKSSEYIHFINDSSTKQKSYWKFTGDTVIVLFASNIMVPLTVGSFLLTLQQKNHEIK